MLTELRRFLTRTNEGQEMWLCEVEVENDTTTMLNDQVRTKHHERYFRTVDGGQRAKKATQVEADVFELEDGTTVRVVPRE